MNVVYTLAELVDRLGGEVVGDNTVKISRIASLSNALTGEISFINDAKYLKRLSNSQASAFVLSAKHVSCTDKPRIVVENPYAYFAKISALLNPPPTNKAGISNSAIIGNSVNIPESCSIGHHVTIGNHVVFGEHVVIKSGTVIEDGVMIGDHSVIESNVTVKYQTQIGKNCHVFSGAVIGSEGFGYAEENGKWLKIPQVGRVIIHDNVDIGANTSIDRGALDDTIVEEGVKLDNLIQVGHNCVIGAHTVIAGCVGIAGSAKIGKHCKIGGAAMILGHLEIVDHVTISPGTMITRSILEANTYTALMPFQTHKNWLTTAAKIRHIDQLSEKVKLLEQALLELKKNH
jgi:UDP-3-O-[3-hydroxymyristoyl] glucosamine N-acyltransferase